MRRVLKYIFWTIFLLLFVAGSGALLTGFYYYFRLTRDLPKIEKLSDYRPKAVSQIYAKDGTLMAELYEQRRYPVKFDEVPPLVRNAFLAAEDANFYTHPGIDFISIVRAVWVNLQRGGAKQGASTITQQVVKALLLSREKTLERKAKEAILSYRLEKALTKDEIFSIYLNEIFLGANSYGIKAASKVHFHKELNELTVAQAAFLAGLPQRPSELMNPRNREEARHRQRYVLGQMLKNRMISQDQYDLALLEPLTIYPPESNNIFHAPYYVGYAIQVADEALHSVDKRLSLVNPGGFTVRTACDLNAYELARRSVQAGLREVDKRRGWRGPYLSAKDTSKKAAQLWNEQIEFGQTKQGVVPGEVYKARIISLSRAGIAEVRVGEFSGTVDLTKASWAKRYLQANDEAIGGEPTKMLAASDIIEVSSTSESTITDPTVKIQFQLDQAPQLEGAFALMNVWSGEVAAVIGGYDYGKSVFNRATQGLLQPGSSFKPFIYVEALDSLHFTPSTIVPDSPISMIAGNGKIWSPGNFDGKFLGPITLRRALEKSRNVVAVYLLSKMGVERGIQSARRLGITTPIDKNMSISLGSAEVKLIEMVRAYSAFASGGRLPAMLVVPSIADRDGKKVYEQYPQQKQVLAEDTAFLMANMMRGVVERGTATVLKKLGKPVSGKTGTTNEHMDAWFIGYTPDWSFGTWVGFDVKRTIGKTETGGKAAAPIVLSFLEKFLKDTPALDFNIPDSVVPVSVDPGSGRQVDAADPNAFIEYFKSGTEPGTDSPAEDFGYGTEQLPQDYLSNDEF